MSAAISTLVTARSGRMRKETAKPKPKAGAERLGCRHRYSTSYNYTSWSEARNEKRPVSYGTSRVGFVQMRWAKPLNHRTDLAQWKQLLQTARVRDARLHDARHTAATVLLELGTPGAGPDLAPGAVDIAGGAAVDMGRPGTHAGTGSAHAEGSRARPWMRAQELATELIKNCKTSPWSQPSLQLVTLPGPMRAERTYAGRT